MNRQVGTHADRDGRKTSQVVISKNGEKMSGIVTQEVIENRIFLIRGRKVMLDRDLAELYGVPTKHLNRQVKRNIKRFLPEFMFQLTKPERIELVPIWHQFKAMKHSYILPYAFTEHGVAMLASILNSERAIRITSVQISVFASPEGAKQSRF